MVAALLMLALPATASAAVAPTLASAFTPASIGVGGTTALSFTITNTNTTTLTGIGFTDTLPAGLTVDSPTGLSVQNCGSSNTVTAPAGGSTITLTGAAVAGNNATCTVQINVTSNAAGSYQNSTGQATSTEGGSGSGDTQTLTVFGLPTVSITSPMANAIVAFGENVTAKYTCADAAGAPGIAACSGDVDSGAPIDTSTAGPGTLTVIAVSADGAIATQTIDYVVLPDNRITVTKVTGHPGGTVTFEVTVPGAGTLTAKLTHDGRTFGQLAKKFRSDGTSMVTIKPGAAGRQLLKAAKKQRHPAPVTLKLTATFVPTGGTAGRPALSTVRVIP